MNEEAIEAAARAMCDRVNGIGDYDENIGQRRTGWMAQARSGIAAYLAAQPLEGLTSEEGLINRSKEWWLRRVGQEPDTFIGAGVEKPDFLTLVKRLVIAARTTGGTAGPDAGLMKALDDVERALAQPLEGLTSECRGDYRGWQIEHNPPPIPCRNSDWSATHPDYDGAEDANDSRVVHGRTRAAVMAEIDAWFEDRTSGKWRWWAGRNDEEYTLAGPCDTRQAAINFANGNVVPGDMIYLVEAIAEDEPDGDGIFAFIETRNHSHIIVGDEA